MRLEIRCTIVCLCVMKCTARLVNIWEEKEGITSGYGFIFATGGRFAGHLNIQYLFTLQVFVLVMVRLTLTLQLP